jgi:hypothetical protein
MFYWDAKSIVKMDQDGIHVTGEYDDCDFVKFEDISPVELKVIEEHAKKTLRYIKRVRRGFKKASKEKHSKENLFETA